MRKNQYTNTKLEVKKIPQELNNITKLNEHFSKFGTIVNIQVGVAMLVTESIYIMYFLRIYFFLAALGLHCCVGLSLVV